MIQSLTVRRGQVSGRHAEVGNQVLKIECLKSTNAVGFRGTFTDYVAGYSTDSVGSE